MLLYTHPSDRSRDKARGQLSLVAELSAQLEVVQGVPRLRGDNGTR